MKTFCTLTAALALGALAAGPSFGAEPAPATPATPSNPSGNMSGNMQNSGMMMDNMSESDRYRARFVFYNLDEREVRRYQALGYSEGDIRGAANIAMRTGRGIDYVLRRLTITGLPIARLAVMMGVPATVVDDEIPGMGMGSMMGGGANMGGMSSGGMMGGTGGGTGTGGTGGGTGTSGGTGTGGGGTGTGGTGTP